MYINDLLFVNLFKSKIDNIKRILNKRFKIININPIYYYFSISINYDEANAFFTFY